MREKDLILGVKIGLSVDVLPNFWHGVNWKISHQHDRRLGWTKSITAARNDLKCDRQETEHTFHGAAYRRTFIGIWGGVILSSALGATSQFGQEWFVVKQGQGTSTSLSYADG